MKIGKLDHVNLHTTQLEEMIEWYTNILGMRSGIRPNFSFPGAWMYSGEDAVVHLVGGSDGVRIGSEEKLKLEHFALSAEGRNSFETRLTEAGEKFKCAEVPGFGIIQYNVWDPDGNHIHIDFSTSE
jgi:catechol 2,3-dioxygenase-like lactoylglutathione lyase family enzyme